MLGSNNAGPPWKAGVVINNVGDIEAVDVEVEAEFVDGSTGRGRLERAPTRAMNPTHWKFVDLDPAPTRNGLADIPACFTEVVLRYWDVDRRGRWERVFTVTEISQESLFPRLVAERLLPAEH
jgi:hypothetical protein